MSKILLVDDEPQIIKFLSISLRSQGYELVTATTGKEAISQVALSNPDLVILDLGLPDLDGQNVLLAIREFSQVPILVLSVRNLESDKVQALDSGANDYVVKPFGVQELLARIRIQLRLKPDSVAEFNQKNLRIDYVTRKVSYHGKEIRLSKKEYALLCQLTEHAGKVLTQTQLMQKIWGPTHLEDTHYLRILVARLRSRLGENEHKNSLIETLPGIGYRFVLD
ncbi:MAG: response regulator [Nitrincola lacisaponensis]|uniref:response regulator n=1 Tax=Nitrincola lacisaponensis TaxID=267850 RepID=UPI00391A5454